MIHTTTSCYCLYLTEYQVGHSIIYTNTAGPLSTQGPAVPLCRALIHKYPDHASCSREVGYTTHVYSMIQWGLFISGQFSQKHLLHTPYS